MPILPSYYQEKDWHQLTVIINNKCYSVTNQMQLLKPCHVTGNQYLSTSDQLTKLKKVEGLQTILESWCQNRQALAEQVYQMNYINGPKT